jgi:hypothetical protein
MPKLFQEDYYNGHYKGHGIKFQAISTPDGLICDLSCPVPGHHHDIFLWYISEVDSLMDDLLFLLLYFISIINGPMRPSLSYLFPYPPSTHTHTPTTIVSLCVYPIHLFLST